MCMIHFELILYNVKFGLKLLYRFGLGFFEGGWNGGENSSNFK